MSGRVARGYALVAGAFLLIGLSGTLVTWAKAPESVLLVLRFAIAGLLGQQITPWTAIGGVLILAAGILVVRYGREDAAPEPLL